MFSKVKTWFTGAQRRVVNGGYGRPDVSILRLGQIRFFVAKFVSALLMNGLSYRGADLITRGVGGGGVLGSTFGGYVPLTSQNPYPIIVYSVASYRPHLSHFWANVIVISRTEFNASRLLNIKTIAGAIFQPRIFLFLNLCLPEFSYPINPENLRPHSRNSTKNVIPL